MDDLSSLVTAAYLGAGVLFILSLGGLSNQESARQGNVYGMVGMGVAIVATALDPRVGAWGLMLVTLGIGGAIGARLALQVEMTSMPQLVAMLHSFVGLAAVLVGFSSYLGFAGHGEANTVHAIEIYADVALGALTFTGSVVAWGKLEGRLSGKPLLLPNRHLMNLAMVVAIALMAVPFTRAALGANALPLVLMMLVAGALGVHLVMAIGGADMPVVVSLLNSYSGWTAAAAGFMLGNDLLIVTGALVGSSGAILSFIMCKAMNRSIWNVVFGGFGATPAPGSQKVLEGEISPIETDGVAELVKSSKSIVIVPGYGMAVAQAQHLVAEFTSKLRDGGKTVRFAIHPVAGRLPGHMNVLLAEAGVPYGIVLEMDEINDDLPKTDLVLVIGANDIVNPSAQEDEGSPIWGMPVLEVWNSATVVVLKRGMSAGYAGVDNPLFLKENTRMYFGDAKESMRGLLAAL
jgi:NAD(P) transhydrogenase subunit beta